MDGTSVMHRFEAGQAEAAPVRRPTTGKTRRRPTRGWRPRPAVPGRAATSGTRVRDESSVFDDLLAFAAGLRKPGTGRWERTPRAQG